MRTPRFLLFVLSSFSCFAQTNSPRPEYSFKVIADPGLPLTVQWKDGREAQVRYYLSDDIVVPFKTSLTENNCTQALPAACTFSIPFRRIAFSFFWTKNPDPERVGKAVEVRVTYDPMTGKTLPPDAPSMYKTLLETGNLQDPSSPTDSNGVGKVESRPQFVCDRVDWIPFDSKGTATLASWLNQLMASNPETGQNENMLFTAYLKTELHQVSSTQFEISKMGIMPNSQPLGSFPQILSGDTVLWNFKAGSGICAQNLSIDTSVVQTAQFTDLLFNAKIPKDAVTTPYLFAPNGFFPNPDHTFLFALTSSYNNSTFNPDGTNSTSITYSDKETEIR